MISQFQMHSLIINEDLSERIAKVKQKTANVVNEIVINNDIIANSFDISELNEEQLNKLLNGLTKLSLSYNK